MSPGGFNLKKPKKPNITVESRFGFYWVLLGFIGCFYWMFLLDVFEEIKKKVL